MPARRRQNSPATKPSSASEELLCPHKEWHGTSATGVGLPPITEDDRTQPPRGEHKDEVEESDQKRLQGCDLAGSHGSRAERAMWGLA